MISHRALRVLFLYGARASGRSPVRNNCYGARTSGRSPCRAGGETPRVADSSAAGACRFFHTSVPPSKVRVIRVASVLHAASCEVSSFGSGGANRACAYVSACFYSCLFIARGCWLQFARRRCVARLLTPIEPGQATAPIRRRGARRVPPEAPRCAVPIATHSERN